MKAAAAKMAPPTADAVVTPGETAIQSLPSFRTTARLAKSESQIEGLLAAAHNQVDLALEQHDAEEQYYDDKDNDGVRDDDPVRKEKGVLFRFLLRKKMKFLGRVASSSSTLHAKSDVRYERLKTGCDVLCKQIDDSIEHRKQIRSALWELGATAKELVANVLSPDEFKPRRKSSNDLRNAFEHLASIMDDCTVRTGLSTSLECDSGGIWLTGDMEIGGGDL